MQFKMSENSLFAYLLRSSWWVSLLVAIIVALIARFFLPDEYMAYALSFAFPFVVIAGIAAWKQWKVPSSARVASTLEAVSAMSWAEFSSLLEQAFQREGIVVTRISGAADFRLVEAGRVSLVCCKRWKAASHGLAPLRELEAARDAQEAHKAIYVAVGNISDNALKYASDHRIGLMQGPELTRLLRLPKTAAKARS